MDVLLICDLQLLAIVKADLKDRGLMSTTLNGAGCFYAIAGLFASSKAISFVTNTDPTGSMGSY